MKQPPKWSKIDAAARWLSDNTASLWTADDILTAAIRSIESDFAPCFRLIVFAQLEKLNKLKWRHDKLDVHASKELTHGLRQIIDGSNISYIGYGVGTPLVVIDQQVIEWLWTRCVSDKTINSENSIFQSAAINSYENDGAVSLGWYPVTSLDEIFIPGEDLQEMVNGKDDAPESAEPKATGETLADNSRVFAKRAMVAELKGIWPSIINDLGEASRAKGELKAANVRRSYWNVDMCIKWAVAHGKITNNQQLKNYVINKDDSPFAVLLKTLLKI